MVAKRLFQIPINPIVDDFIQIVPLITFAFLASAESLRFLALSVIQRFHCSRITLQT
jgi:hypothetical protein